jgi:hypothetical protein
MGLSGQPEAERAPGAQRQTLTLSAGSPRPIGRGSSRGSPAPFIKSHHIIH